MFHIICKLSAEKRQVDCNTESYFLCFHIQHLLFFFFLYINYRVFSVLAFTLIICPLIY